MKMKVMKKRKIVIKLLMTHKFTERDRTSSQVGYLAFIACKEETKTAIEAFFW